MDYCGSFYAFILEIVRRSRGRKQIKAQNTAANMIQRSQERAYVRLAARHNKVTAITLNKENNGLKTFSFSILRALK